MAENNNTAKGALWVGAGAALVAAIALAKNTAAAAPSAVVGLSKEVMDLLTSMAQGTGAILDKLDEISLKIGGGGGSFPPNADGIIARFVNCPLVQPNAYQLPDIVIPTNMQLTILARSGPLATLNTGIIWVANGSANASQPFQSYPLTPGSTISFAVKNASSIWISSTVPNEGVFITVEDNGG